jgi:putative phosphoesterase
MSDREILVGIISDTHGLLRPEALAALQGSELIIHAGDVGRPEVLDALRGIAPTFAARGNIDTQAWAAALPTTDVVEVGSKLFWVLHDIAQLDIDPAAAGFDAVVFGHSHQPSIERRNGVLYLNPGSAGPRRFRLPVTVARVRVAGSSIEPEIVQLNV